jgi:hypothetical protein
MLRGYATNKSYLARELGKKGEGPLKAVPAFELGVGKILAQLGLGPGVSSTQMLIVAYARVYNNVLTNEIGFSDFAPQGHSRR